MKQHIDFIEKEYNNFLEVEKILNKTQDSFKKHFKIKDEEKDWKLQNLNPLRYEHDIETGMKNVGDNVIRMIIQLFKEDYPNVDLDDKDFEDSILTFKNKQSLLFLPKFSFQENFCKSLIKEYCRTILYMKIKKN